MNKTEYTEIKQMALNGDTAKAVSAIMDAYDDKPMADIMRQLSGQLDFYEEDEENGALSRTYATLDAMIKERKDRHASLYLDKLTDDMIREMSSGEVTEVCYDYLGSQYEKNGLFDPAIFGGEGLIQAYDPEKGFSVKSFGTRMGHIELPCHVVLPSSYDTIASMLHLDSDDVRRIATGYYYVDIEKNTLVPAKELNEYQSEKETSLFTEGDAIYHMLCNLHYGDKPERLAFQVVPVISPVTRIMLFNQEKEVYEVSGINNHYERIISRSNRIKKLEGMRAPEIILLNEKRILAEYVNALYQESEEIKLKLQNRFSKGNARLIHDYFQYTVLSRQNKLNTYHLPEVPATEIKSLHVFPEQITLQLANGDKRFIFLRDVDAGNEDAILSFDKEHAMILPDGVDPDHLPEDLQAESDAIDREREILTGIRDEVLDGAKQDREAFTVFLDQKYSMYRKV